MKDVIEKLDQWREKKAELAVTTVIETWGSAPRPVGSKMITTRAGQIAGSVSAGCVEGAVIQEAQIVMDTGKPRLIEFGVADDEAWEVGLACGGQIKVFIEPGFALDSTYESMKAGLSRGEKFTTLTLIDGEENFVNKKLLVKSDGQVVGDLPIQQEDFGFLNINESGIAKILDGSSIFVEVHPRPAKLVIIGAVHMADPLVKMANELEFETILIDPREAFATRERFPHADEIITQWPQDALNDIELDDATYVVILSHDPKVDDPALQLALESEARYIGALGSKRTNKKRVERLIKAGMTEKEISRLHAPIGLPLGGQSPAEIAVSVMAEIIREKNKN
jgi:xanthine dehydrogenase accessory factor